MVGRGRGDNVAVAGDLAGESGDGAGDLVDFAKEAYSRKATERGGRGRFWFSWGLFEKEGKNWRFW